MTRARATPTMRLAVSTGLVTTAVLASMLGLTTVVLPPWTGTGVAGVLLVGAVLLVTRAAIGGRRARVTAAVRAGAVVHRVPYDNGGASSVLPTLAGTVVAAWYLLARFGGVGGTTQWLAGTGSVSRLANQLGAAGTIVREEVAPVIGTAPTALMCVGGTLAVLIVADALASGLRHPLLAAGSIIVLWLPPLILTSRVPRPTFVITVAALLLCLSLDNPATARRRVHDAHLSAQVRRAGLRRAVRITATAAGVTALALAATSITSGPGLGRGWTGLFATTTGSVRLADDLDMYRSLTSRSGAVVLTYTTTGGSAGPLRLMTLSTFDGRNWSTGPDADGAGFTSEQILFPQDIHPQAAATRLDITVGAMREDRLPLPVEPRSVTAGGGWRYDAARDEVVGGPTTQEGDEFSLVVHPRDLSAASLRDAPPGARDAGEAFVRVPSTSHAADIEKTAHEIAGDARTDFDRAVALQSYLRDTQRFTYDVDVPRGLTGDAVWDFLQQRRGYCVQFATTMVMLARALGIPARLAVGYLPGTPVDGGEHWNITGQDSHAWPELYFPGSGWVRFEPTPAVQSGAAPQYTDPSADQEAPAPAPTADERPAATSVPSAQAPAPSATAQAPQGESARASRQVVVGWLLGACGVLLAGVVVLVLWLRRRSARPPRDAEEAWARVITMLGEAGVTLPASTTPRRAPHEAAGAWVTHTGQALPDDVRDALATLAKALESERYAHERYAQGDEPLDSNRLAELTRAVAAGLTTARRARPGTKR